MAPALPILDLATSSGRQDFEARLARLRGTTSLVGDTARAVADIIEDVRRRGDAAVVELMRRFSDPAFEASSIRVAEGDFERAEASLDPALRESIEGAIANVRAYQQHILPGDVDAGDHRAVPSWGCASPPSRAPGSRCPEVPPFSSPRSSCWRCPRSWRASTRAASGS